MSYGFTPYKIDLLVICKTTSTSFVVSVMYVDDNFLAGIDEASSSIVKAYLLVRFYLYCQRFVDTMLFLLY